MRWESGAALSTGGRRSKWGRCLVCDGCSTADRSPPPGGRGHGRGRSHPQHLAPSCGRWLSITGPLSQRPRCSRAAHCPGRLHGWLERTPSFLRGGSPRHCPAPLSKDARTPPHKRACFPAILGFPRSRINVVNETHGVPLGVGWPAGKVGAPGPQGGFWPWAAWVPTLPQV